VVHGDSVAKLLNKIVEELSTDAWKTTLFLRLYFTSVLYLLRNGYVPLCTISSRPVTNVKLGKRECSWVPRLRVQYRVIISSTVGNYRRVIYSEKWRSPIELCAIFSTSTWRSCAMENKETTNSPLAFQAKFWTWSEIMCSYQASVLNRRGNTAYLGSSCTKNTNIF